MLLSRSLAANDRLAVDSPEGHRDRDGLLVAASLAFAAASGFGSTVSVRSDVRGEPLSVRAPLSTAAGIAAGWGAGVAAPWPMPLLGLVVAWRGHGSRRGLVCATLGAMCVAGTVVEPVTWRRRRWSRGVATAIALNLATSLAMIAAGLHDRRGAG